MQYSNTAQGGSPTFTKGIWKSVSLVQVAPGSVAITDVVPQISYAGEYPTSPLTDATHSGFDVHVRVHTWAARPTSGTLAITGAWDGGSRTQLVAIGTGNTSTTVALPTATAVKLWWPSGHGAQPLYNLSATFTPSMHGASAAQGVAAAAAAAAAGGEQPQGVRVAGGQPVTAVRRVGFRFFALVTGNDTDPAYVAASKGKDGTSSLGMLWRVNGAAIFVKGANMIPMEELEGRMSASAHRQLVHSAADGGMNVLRVWGGGIFLPRAWYEACDELGVMVYHDMQYSHGHGTPQNDATQDAELRHQIRRLASHPCIVVWDGCNECSVVEGTPDDVFRTFVMTVVAEEDSSRAIWPSCPALGWTGGVDRLTAIPNGNVLRTPKNATPIETHGPYQHGGGFPAVNGDATFEPVAAAMHGGMPITLSAPAGKQQHAAAAGSAIPGARPSMPVSTPPMPWTGTFRGLGRPSVFASEFGASVYSSFESMSPTIAKEHWSIHGGARGDSCSGGQNPSSPGTGRYRCNGTNAMSLRNYPCDNIITQYFGPSNFDAANEHSFKKQLWQCMVGQALLIKSDIETRRSKNQFGIIVWQLNLSLIHI